MAIEVCEYVEMSSHVPFSLELPIELTPELTPQNKCGSNSSHAPIGAAAVRLFAKKLP
jgi:hypothetical protein